MAERAAMSTSRRVAALLDQLTVDELVDLTAGRTMWTTWPIDRLEIPRLRVSDGPAGVRGSRFDGPASLNVPCGTALAATWDPALIRGIGELLGRELLAKGARMHLAPTVNLHRTPVGGRNFECMSEDPLLTAMIAVEYVRGVQSLGVGSCIKHFVGNDTEFERMTIDSQIDERTLREMYLVPFERAVRDADVMSVMTSYNRINGLYAADSRWLLEDVLRGEWGFDGLVVSDWFGVKSTADAVNAGTDLEMPGPPLWRGDKLREAVHRSEVSVDTLRERARNVLHFLERTGGLDEPPGAEISRDDPEDVALIRRAGAASMVLLKNDEVLPLAIDAVTSVAVIGPNAEMGMVMGGGSAHVTPTAISHPLEAMIENFEPRGVAVMHAQGCNINRSIPEFDLRLCDEIVVEYFADPDDLDSDRAPDLVGETGTFRLTWFNDPLGRRGRHGYGVRMRFRFAPHVSGEWTFGVQAVGEARVCIDGVDVVSNIDAPVGGSFFGTGTTEVRGAALLVAEQRHDVLIELRHRPTGMGVGGINAGAMAPVLSDPIADAVAVAAAADVSIVIVGTNDDWESEGWDRHDIALPGDQDRLITEVARVSKRTIVVINAGSPVSMPWIDDVDAVLMAWFPGQEFGHALVDVLTGEVEPTGRLPVTFPRRMEDTPAFEHHPGRNGVAPYAERRLMGYRWYDTVGREPLFPFGFGLGYARIGITDVFVGDAHNLEVTLTNTSARQGSEVVQVYAHLVDRAHCAADEPDQRLVGFVRVDVPAHSTVSIAVVLDVDAYRAWDADAGQWTQWAGEVELRVGVSSRHVAQCRRIVV